MNNHKELYKEILSNKYGKYGEDVDICIKGNENKLTVFFLGSNSKTDWENNFRFWTKLYKKQISPMLVHKGFARAYRSCKDDLMESIKLFANGNNLDINNLEVIFTGHSFGGAMALLAAEDFAFRFNKKPTVITFGAPKVFFGRKAVKYIKSCYKNVIQYAHRSDIVTKVPPFYHHINIYKTGEFKFFGLFNPEKYHLSYDK